MVEFIDETLCWKNENGNLYVYVYMFKTWCYRSMDKTVWFLRKKEP